MSGLRAKRPDESLLALNAVCCCGHTRSYHDADGCHAFTGIGLEYDCACRAFVPDLMAALKSSLEVEK